jgi:hypothetical protein
LLVQKTESSRKNAGSARGRVSSIVALLLCYVLGLQAAPALSGRAGVWKTIELGTVQNVVQLREVLESAGCGRALVAVSGQSQQSSCHLGDDANEALGQPEFRLSAEIRTIDLARVNVGDLGFLLASMPTISEVFQKANRAGLSLCPAEVGPQLRLQYLDQPPGEFLAIAMAPLSDYAREPILFLVGNGGAGLLLASRTGALKTKMSPAVDIVFCIGKSADGGNRSSGARHAGIELPELEAQRYRPPFESPVKGAR